MTLSPFPLVWILHGSYLGMAICVTIACWLSGWGAEIKLTAYSGHIDNVQKWCHILTAQVVTRYTTPPQREIRQSNGCHSCLGHSVILRHNKNETKMCLWILADLIRWKLSAGRGRRGRRSRLPSPRRPSSGSPPNHSRATPWLTRASWTFRWGVNNKLSSWRVRKFTCFCSRTKENIIIIYLSNLTYAEARRAVNAARAWLDGDLGSFCSGSFGP